MQNLMLDLETLGSRPGSVIASIGAVFFDPKTGKTGAEFEVLIDIDKSIEAGFSADEDTVIWWESQPAEAKQQLQGTVDPKQALIEFNNFCLANSKNIEWVKVWANGVTFDIALLEAMYHELGVAFPFKFWNVRDLRTLIALGREIAIDRKTIKFEGVQHCALDDCKHQIKVASVIWNSLFVNKY